MNKLDNSPKIISLFSGCGGLDLGFHQEGYETVWANDFDHWACETFKKNIGDVIVEGDIEQIDPYDNNSIPDCDIVLGGFPCQDFSMIWKRPGLDGERGNLYKSFLRVVDAKKPKVFVAENVKGLLTANNKKAIKLFTYAAQNNVKEAQYELSRLYSNPEIIDTDLEKSIYWNDLYQDKSDSFIKRIYGK